jgi:hypothetical protein
VFVIITSRDKARVIRPRSHTKEDTKKKLAGSVFFGELVGLNLKVVTAKRTKSGQKGQNKSFAIFVVFLPLLLFIAFLIEPLYSIKLLQSSKLLLRVFFV